ncbi:hypothetical protein [Streptomyces cirratus]|uniref:hypothetical protein n=1 Tax=Streptomyces cirratus TaxID=68187 RepID=UPI00167E16BB
MVDLHPGAGSDLPPRPPRLHIARRETFTLTDQIRTIDIDAQYVIGDPGDHLVKTDVAQVEFALARLLQLHAEPDL